MQQNWFEQQRSNKKRTIYLITLFILLVIAIGALFGGLLNKGSINGMIGGAIIGLIISLIYALLMQSSLSMDLVMSMNHAKPIDVNDYLQLDNIVTEMCLAAQIPKPKLYLVDTEEKNAFATGINPQKAGLAVTSGILNALNREELTGVIGHEVSHIKNGDMKVTTLANAFSSAINIMGLIATEISYWMMWFGPRDDDDQDSNSGASAMVYLVIYLVANLISFVGNLLASVLTLALSRNREYLADASSAELTKNPKGLIQALQKISMNTKEEEKDQKENHSYATAGYINKPKQKDGLFDTHPSIESRINKLNKML
ncbi:M48 family metalloprotease [Lactobacillus sp. S2-2]|uniref:M48 family metalloprotease n=1 Tax=Lactobacillus sp. S2-2 TaxID=2692917 RepID=UPI001F00F58D|nr:M48 family metalloprotease [Lactobacillus sp. S2-2]MCF6514571.1 M48 family metalloprotease [Lactobacillus sp. S2-2]